MAEKTSTSIRPTMGRAIKKLYQYPWERYFKIHNTANLPYSKLQIMNYSNMVMVWAEIVLYKDVA
jgi:hypothetical protein